MGHNKSYSHVDDDFEFDESYFRKFYKPLSNLPTPPPSSRNSSATQSPRMVAEDTEIDASLLGTSYTTVEPPISCPTGNWKLIETFLYSPGSPPD
jgi:hypothetical protein